VRSSTFLLVYPKLSGNLELGRVRLSRGGARRLGGRLVMEDLWGGGGGWVRRLKGECLVVLDE